MQQDDQVRRSPHVDAILEVIEQVPPGSVVTYGDVAELAERGSARGVGQILAHWGAEVPWWRVVNASGRPPPHHLDEAVQRLRDEGVPMNRAGTRVDLARARWTGPLSEGPGSLSTPGPAAGRTGARIERGVGGT